MQMHPEFKDSARWQVTGREWGPHKQQASNKTEFKTSEKQEIQRNNS